MTDLSWARLVAAALFGAGLPIALQNATVGAAEGYPRFTVDVLGLVIVTVLALLAGMTMLIGSPSRREIGLSAGLMVVAAIVYGMLTPWMIPSCLVVWGIGLGAFAVQWFTAGKDVNPES